MLSSGWAPRLFSGRTRSSRVRLGCRVFTSSLRYQSLAAWVQILAARGLLLLLRHVSFNIRGNEYKGRYYVNLQAWRIEHGEAKVESDLANVTDDSGSGNLDDLEESPF